jgi:hypothetical protein
MRIIRGIRGSLLVSSLALAGCGGGVSGIDHPGPPPGDDEISADGGPGDDSIDSRCTSEAPIGTGFACSSAGLSCPLGTLTDCNGGRRTLECSCDGRSWTCDPVDPIACPPPTACPDPSQVFPNGPCAGAEGQVCNSTDFPVSNCGGEPPPPVLASCQCLEGSWQCELPAIPACSPPAPPPSCPDPNSVEDGVYCSEVGQACPGNPSYCNGQVYYDALTCVANYWLTKATTQCDIGLDGGPDAWTFDGGTFEGGQVLEND